MGVISFPQLDRWRIWRFTDEFGRDAIDMWLELENIQQSHINLMETYCDLFRSGGSEILPGVVVQVDDDGKFYAMHVRPPRQKPISPIFCYGPIDAETEITFLVGAPRDGGVTTARDLLSLARHHCEILLKDPGRRRL